MKLNVPQNIYQYLQQQKIPLPSLAFIKLTNEGIIVEINGDVVRNRLDTLHVGTPISQYFYFADGLFPIEISPLVFPNMLTAENVYVDVHFVQTDTTDVWMILQDKTDSIADIRHLLQRQNEQAFFEQQSSTNKEQLSSRLFAFLGTVVFEFTGLDGFRLVDVNASWFQQLFPDYQQMPKVVDITEYFPFIETFLDEAIELWKHDNDDKVMSNVWTESVPIHGDLYLRAYAANISQRHYLVIGTVDTSISEKQDLLQKARERTLQYEALLRTENLMNDALIDRLQLVTNLSNRLLSPLTTIVSLMEVISISPSLSDNFSNKKMSMLASTQKELVQLIMVREKLHYWSKLELKKFKPSIQNVDIVEQIKVIGETLSPMFNEKKVILKITLPEILTIRTDEELFELILKNLITNALNFSVSDTTVNVTVYKEDKKVRLTISDQGVGITDKQMRQIQAGWGVTPKKDTNGEAGLGIGLVIVQRAIDLLEWQLNCTSKPNKGTTFEINIKI